MKRARANLWPWTLLLAIAACRGGNDKVFEVTAAAPSLVGLIETPACVVSVTDVGGVSCLSPTGQTLWRAEVCRPVRQRPAVIGGSLFVACDSGEWTALDVKTGRPRWKQTGRRAPVAPVASDTVQAFIAAADGSLEAIDETGLSRWVITAGPRVWAGGAVVATSSDKGVLVLEASGGARMWADDKPAVALSGDDALVVAARLSGDLVAWDVANGHARWGVTLGAFAPDTLAVEGDAVTVGLQRGDVVTLALADGAERSRVTLPSPLAAPVAYGVAVMQGREGCATGLGGGATVCVDHALRGSAVVRDGILMLGPRDGRVLGFRLRAAP